MPHDTTPPVAGIKPFSPLPVRSLNTHQLIIWLKSKHNFHKAPFNFTDEQLKDGVAFLNLELGQFWLDYDGDQYYEIQKSLDDRAITLPQICSLSRLCVALLQLKWRLGSTNPMTEAVDPKLRELLRRARSSNNTVPFYSELKKRKLPFFATEELRPASFSHPTEGPASTDSFLYYGRKKFQQLATKVNESGSKTYRGRNLYLHGTFGSGKSYLMAAYALYLVARGKRVIYIPDCRLLALQPSPFSSLQKALCLAFADDEEMTLRIYNIDSEDSLRRFFIKLSDEGVIVYFLIDQMDALENMDPRGDNASAEQRKRTKTLLDFISGRGRHVRIQTVTGKKFGKGQDPITRLDTSESVPLYGGLDKEEMTAWWNTEGFGLEWRDELGESGRRYIEDLTGGLPYLLAEISSITLQDYKNRVHSPKRAKYFSEERDGSKITDYVEVLPPSSSLAQPEEANVGSIKSDPDAIKLESNTTTGWESPKKEDIRVGSTTENKERAVLKDDTMYEKLAWLADRVAESKNARRVRMMICNFAIKFMHVDRGSNSPLTAYESTLACCLTNRKLEKETADPHLDHRFLYIENTLGHVSGGLFVSSCYADILRIVKPKVFLENLWFESLQPSLRPSELGFLLESICLSWIPLCGLEDVGIEKNCRLVSFSFDRPSFIRQVPTFAVPSQSNFPDVDALYWQTLTSGDSRNFTSKIRIIGLRIALQDWRADVDAEARFISKARGWVEQHFMKPGSEGEYGMVWLVESRKSRDPIQQKIDAETTEMAQLRQQRDPPHANDAPLPAYTRYIYEIRELGEKIARGIAVARNKPFVPVPGMIPMSVGPGEGKLKRKRNRDTTDDTTSKGNPESTSGYYKIDLKKQRTSATRSNKNVAPPQRKETTSGSRARTARRGNGVLQCLGSDGKSIEIVKTPAGKEDQGDEEEDGGRYSD